MSILYCSLSSSQKRSLRKGLTLRRLLVERCWSRQHLHGDLATPHEAFRILFFGRDEFSGSGDINCRRGSKLSISPLKILGNNLDLPVHTIPHEKSAFRSWQPPPPFSHTQTSTVEPLQPASSGPSLTHVLITASFGRILPPSLLSLFLPFRRLNVHPSLLPAYRGAAPIQHALLDGRTETGVCIIEMMERKKGIDAGAIWTKKHMKIPDGAMFPDLRDTLARQGGELLVSVLRDMLAGKATAIPQTSDPSAPRAPAITAEDAIVDFMTMSAEHVVRRYRAVSHQKPIAAYLKTKRTLQLHSPSVYTPLLEDVHDQLPAPGTAIYHPPTAFLLIRCASDTILAVPQVKQQDRSLLKAREWWNGVRPEMRINGGDEGPVQFLNSVATQA
ncbi:hypothetical protein AcW1_009440 [Taiwanofungus camphoratus]|nr:hypothetical protein AcW1_009440 [Antrodia cinnamomea]